MYVIGFNGPPQCGKDSLARLLVKELESRHEKLPTLEVSLSTPLRQIAYSMTGFDGSLEGPDYEKFKNNLFDFGETSVTGRQLLIDISERFLKPCYGPQILVRLLLRSLPNWMFSIPCVVMIRDCGFQTEVDPIIEKVGRENFLVCRVLRPGFDQFTNDSREWVFHPVPKMNTLIHNNGTLKDLAVEAGRLYGRLVNQKGWKFD